MSFGITLERKCGGRHEHLAWGKADTHDGFATAEECAYNEHMCASWAQAIYDYAVAQGFHMPPPDMQQVTSGPDVVQINKTILGCLPRGRKVPPLLTGWSRGFSKLMTRLQCKPNVACWQAHS